MHKRKCFIYQNLYVVKMVYIGARIGLDTAPVFLRDWLEMVRTCAGSQSVLTPYKRLAIERNVFTRLLFQFGDFFHHIS